MTRSVRRVSDIEYAEVVGFRPLELDLYLPDADGPLPVIIHVHGGGWRRGSRRQVLPRLGEHYYKTLAAEGFAVAAIDYRLSGEARFPAALDDVRSAVAWVREHAGFYGLDAERVFLWGESAGAHLALLVALAKQTDDEVSGVVAWFPPTDLSMIPGSLEPDSREAQFLGVPAVADPALAMTASPISYVRADAPPILLMHGDADDMVPTDQSIRLADALRAAGAQVELELVPGARHFWDGAADVTAIVRRSIDFARVQL